MIKQVNDMEPLRFTTLRIQAIRSDGEIIDIGSLSGGRGEPDTAKTHPMLVSEDRWRQLIFDAIFTWMNSVLEAADDEEE